MAAGSGALLSAFPDKPPKAAPIRDPGAGAATAGECSVIGALALGPGSARFAIVREGRMRNRSLPRHRRSQNPVYGYGCLSARVRSHGDVRQALAFGRP